MRLIPLTLALSLLAGAAWADETADWKAQAARISIVRDDWGIAHIKGKTDADAVFGMAYAQAEDDFNRVEMNYLTSLGRVAEAEGAKAVWQDLRMRLFIDPADLQAKYRESPAWLRALMDSWADGLNYYLATHPQTKPKVLTRFEPWMALSFTEGSIGGDIERISLSELEAFYGGTRTAALPEFAFKDPPGSNGIALAPKVTKDGHALLLINPHTSFFFRSELQVTSDEGLNAYGAVTWGQFFIYQGFNEKAGWMHTSSGVDVVDEFAETIVRTPGSLMYRYGREARPVTVKDVTIRVRGADGSMGSRTFTTYRTHHGPIVRAEGDKWIATALMFKPIEALQQSFLRTKATDLTGFLKVAELKANSSNNTLYADAQGQTAYLHPQFIPKRDDRFDYTKVVDGADPATDWQGLHALSEAPTVIDPKAGWAYNSNNWPYSAAGADSPKREAFPKYMDTAGETPRGLHAIRVLEGKSGFTMEGLRAAAYDPDLPAFDRLIPKLSAAYDLASPDQKTALAGQMAALKAWDRRWGRDSTETSLAVFWAEALWSKSAPGAKVAGMTVYEYMVEKSPASDRIAALEEASARLVADFGSWKTPWGEINRFQRLDGAIVQTFRDDGPSVAVPFTAGTWGSLASFASRRYPGTKRYYGTSGNSFVAVVEFGPKVKAMAISAGGESGDPDSKHFNDQAERYAKAAFRHVYFYPEQLRGHVERTYRPGE
ncbi:penicillin acylase family protein [Phenylobacterium sp.]|uniref:penicillin acylase family protein n=1 Tax=Phenylobacterium sp. TaxID=1871053 RepID=UPI003D2C8BA2